VRTLHLGNARLQRDTTVGVIAREVLEQRLLVQREQIGRLREEHPFYRTLGWPVDEGGRVIFGTVFGNVVSEVDSSCLVNLSESGRVEGETRVPNVLVNGVVSGNVFSTEICS